MPNWFWILDLVFLRASVLLSVKFFSVREDFMPSLRDSDSLSLLPSTYEAVNGLKFVSTSSGVSNVFARPRAKAHNHIDYEMELLQRGISA